MDRFPCHGHFSIRYNNQRVVTITASHAIPHIKYQRTDVPSKVEERMHGILEFRVASNVKNNDVLAIIHEEFNNQYHWLTDNQIRNRMTDVLLKPLHLGNNPGVSIKKLFEQEEGEGNVVYLDMCQKMQKQTHKRSLE